MTEQINIRKRAREKAQGGHTDAGTHVRTRNNPSTHKTESCNIYTKKEKALWEKRNF